MSNPEIQNKYDETLWAAEVAAGAHGNEGIEQFVGKITGTARNLAEAVKKVIRPTGEQQS